MNVAGAGYASVMAVLFFLALISPVSVVWIFNNLGAFARLSKKARVLFYFIGYLTTLLMEGVLITLFRSDYIEVIGAFICLIIFLFLPTSFIVKQFRGVIARRIYIALAIIILVLTYIYTKPYQYYVNENFEKELISSLNLKPLLKDSLLTGSQISLKNDTLYGVKSVYPYNTFFTRCLKDKQFGIDIKIDESRYTLINYHNGYFYRGGRSDFLIEKFDQQGEWKSICQYKNIDYIEGSGSKTLNYKDLVLVKIGKKIIIFNEKLNKIIDKETGDCELFDNKLIIVNENNSVIQLKCLNLDSLNVMWQQEFRSTFRIQNSWLDKLYGMYIPPFDIVLSQNCISLLTNNNVYLIDAEAGSIKWSKKIGSINPEPYGDSNVRYLFVGEKCLLNVNNTLSCISVNTNKIYWKIKNCKLYGINKGKVLVASLNESNIFIVDVKFGEILSKIKNNESAHYISFIGQYMFVYNNDGAPVLYQ